MDYGRLYNKQKNVSITPLDIYNLYPIGSIYISVIDVNPANYFGGIWEAFGTGRTLVGVDATQTEFNTVLKTGGHKYLQAHRHIGLSWLGDDAQQSITLNGGSGAGYNLSYTGGNVPNQQANIQTRSAGQGNAQNLQPYITVYMWRRIS